MAERRKTCTQDQRWHAVGVVDGAIPEIRDDARHLIHSERPDSENRTEAGAA